MVVTPSFACTACCSACRHDVTGRGGEVPTVTWQGGRHGVRRGRRLNRDPRPSVWRRGARPRQALDPLRRLRLALAQPHCPEMKPAGAGPASSPWLFGVGALGRRCLGVQHGLQPSGCNMHANRVIPPPPLTCDASVQQSPFSVWRLKQLRTMCHGLRGF